jgi:hypothetical protein
LLSSEQGHVCLSSPHGCGKGPQRQEAMRAMGVMRFAVFEAVGFGGKRRKV